MNPAGDRPCPPVKPCPRLVPASAGRSIDDWSFWSTEKTSVGDDSFVPPDPEAPEYFTKMADFYFQAARLLPIAEIPDLARCITMGGVAIGLADPVTNIVLSTLYMLAVSQPYLRNLEDLRIDTRKKSTFFHIACGSRRGLVQFMMCYFRYLPLQHAWRFLRMAGHDLVVAIHLAEHARCGGRRPADPVVVPDAARTKTAFRRAVQQIVHLPPDDLVRVMTSRYPRDLLNPLLDDIRGGKELSADRVYEICNLLRHPWSPSPDCRDAAEASDILTASATESRLLSCLQGDPLLGNTIQPTAQATDLLMYMKMSLLDTMHGFYIQALAMLPDNALREGGHLIRAVLTAGHCFGNMDPVSNIILNSIWYDIAFPLPKDDQFKAADDILDARSLPHIESHSLNALIFLLRDSYNMTEHEAVALLCSRDKHHELSRLIACLCYKWPIKGRKVGKRLKIDALDAAAKLAKHPQPSPLAYFLKHLPRQKLDLLRFILTLGNGLNELALKLVKIIISYEPYIKPHVLCQPALETRRLAFMQSQAFIRPKLEKLLCDDGTNNPHGQRYKLGAICGVTTARYGPNTICYHVNFLASTQGDVDAYSTLSSRASRLFFAELWSEADARFEQSTKPPLCCLIQDYHAYVGCCFVCETASSRIVHPPSGEHFMGHAKRTLGDQRLDQCGSDLGGMLEPDLIYNDRERDFEFPMIRNESGLPAEMELLASPV